MSSECIVLTSPEQQSVRFCRTSNYGVVGKVAASQKEILHGGEDDSFADSASASHIKRIYRTYIGVCFVRVSVC